MDLERGRQRRRGAELEAALLDAAWAELTERGYAAFTIDAVAQRAGTSKPVVYRRWPGKEELVRAAIRHASAKSVRVVPDTGTLRGDLLALMRWVNRERLEFAAVATVHLGAYFQETGTSLADLRELVMAGTEPRSDIVMRRAVERGEIDGAKLTPRIKDLPFSLLRHEVLFTLRPVPEKVMEEIVDTIFLPLVRRD